jgi:hypothetical protein
MMRRVHRDLVNKFETDETNQQLLALDHQGTKEAHKVSCRKIAGLCGLLFFFPWWSLRG